MEKHSMYEKHVSIIVSLLFVVSLMSVAISSIPIVSAQVSEWQPYTDYTVGDVVSYQGVLYECRQSHTSLPGWEPPNVPALWLEIEGEPPPEDTTPPAAPTGLTATAVSSSQINLDWANNTEGDLDHYNVYRSTTSGFTPGPGTFVASTTTSSYSNTGLSASTTYYYKVTAVDTSNNESSPSAQASATTEEGPPPPGGWDFECHSYTHPYLTTLSAAGIESELDQVDAAFQAHGLGTPRHHAYPYGEYNSTVISALQSHGRLSGRAAWAVTGSLNTPPVNWYEMNSVEIQSSTAVSTITGYIDQAITNDALLLIFTHRVMDPAPQYGCTPTTLSSICSYLSGSVTVMSMAQAYNSYDGSQAIVVLQFDDGWKTDYTTTWGILSGYGFVGTSYIYPDAQDGNWTDFLSWAEVEEMAEAEAPPPEDTTPPAAPTGLTATAVSSSQINLDWANNTEGDLDHYNVYRSTTSGFTPGPGNFVTERTVSSYSNTGLSASTTYYYKVTAEDTSGNESDPSAQASATTEEEAEPPPPSAGDWNFECHSYTHPQSITASEMQQVNDAFAAHGLPAPLHHAYPFGNVNQSVAAAYRLSGRTVGGIMETAYPVPNWYQLKATEIQSGTAWSTIQGWVDQCISQVGMLHIFSHRVTDPAPQYGMTPAMLNQLLDYLVTKQNAGQLTVMTMRDAYDAWNGTAPIVVISFDDGWLSDYTTTWGIFKAHGLLGTSYIYPQPMDEMWTEFMSWALVEEMAGLRAARPAPGPSVTRAGVRESTYGISPFPSAEEWTNDMNTMASYWSGSQPTAIWIVGIMDVPLGSNMTLQFPEPAGGPYSNITFESTDMHESYLDYFDTHGIDVWLQVEPAFADMNTLIDLVFDQYGHHSCVKGFGVDCEWYRYTAQDEWGIPVTDSNAQTWESRVKSHNSNYTLFLKHFNYTWLPPSYRGDIIFVSDSQDFNWEELITPEDKLDALVYEATIHWAPWFYPNPVWFQIGYESDQNWWETLANPPKNIGDAIDAETTQDTGIFWVDFTLRDVFPYEPPPEDTTPPAAPTGLTATAVSSSQINLDWANNTEGDLDHYNVYRSTTSGFTPGPGNFVTERTVSNYSDTGLSASTTYYYKVTAVDTSNNESNPSAQASATTEAAPPPPTMTAYYCDVDSMSSALPMTVGGNLNSKTEATSSEYTAIASSDGSRWTTPDPGYGDEVFLWLEMYTEMAVETIGSIELHFEGYLSSESANFSIWARDLVNGEWDQIGTTESIATGADGTITRTITANIANYIDASGKIIWGVYESADSRSLNIDYVYALFTEAAPDTTPPAAPTGLTATAVSSSQINLDWNNNTEGDLDHYNVYRSTTSGFTPGAGTFVGQTTSSSYSDTGLSASTTYYYKVTAVDTSGNESSPSAQASATTEEGAPPMMHAGLRASSYGVSPFPDAEEWETDMKEMASYWPGSQPTGIWLVGLMEPPDVLGSNCHLEFPEPAGGPYQNITFESTDLHESYFDYFDTHGIDVWLQVEPGDANMNTLIDLVLDQYGHHSCVKGFGLDVEWYTTTGASVTDSNAQTWESRVKSHNSSYTLFIKFWNIDRTPPSYRGDIIFVDDSQQFSSLAEMVSEFANYWAPEFYPNPVWFQYGYEADQVWWQNLTNPPKDIGDAINDAIPQECGLFWVDFTMRDVFPPEGDTTPPAAPTGLTATAVSSSQINLDWNNNTEGDLDHYNVYRSTTSGFTPGAGTFVGQTTSSSYSDTGLSSSTTYYYKVTAVDTSNNESNPSAQASATTEAAPPPPTMTAYYCDVDSMSSALPMTVGGNLNSKTEATSSEYTAIASSDGSRWTTPDPGYGDEVFLWLEMYTEMAVETIGSIELHFEGYLSSESANFSIWARDLVNGEWDQIGTTESIATGADGTITRTITANIANYIDADGKLIWGVYESADSRSLNIDYVNMVYSTEEAPPEGNLALNQPAYASTEESSSLTAEMAVDGDTSTRWASQDPAPGDEWIYVDLGATATINRVVLNWEVAYASAYEIQVSDDASSWTTIYSTSSGDGGIDDLGVSGTGRYVRVYCTVRGTSYGYSLWEFEVYGTT